MTRHPAGEMETPMILFFCALFYVCCSLYGWGSAIADFSHISGNPRDYIGSCVLIALTGPIGACAAVFATNFNQHGWKLWSKPQ